MRNFPPSKPPRFEGIALCDQETADRAMKAAMVADYNDWAAENENASRADFAEAMTKILGRTFSEKRLHDVLTPSMLARMLCRAEERAWVALTRSSRILDARARGFGFRVIAADDLRAAFRVMAEVA